MFFSFTNHDHTCLRRSTVLDLHVKVVVLCGGWAARALLHAPRLTDAAGVRALREARAVFVVLTSFIQKILPPFT